MAQVLRHGIRTNFAVISLLVVSTAEICEKITEGLLKSTSAQKYRVLVHRCESIDEIITKWNSLHVDFIVFAFDSRISLSLIEVEKNIFLVDQSFILYGQSCLVHANNVSTHAMGINTDKILELSYKYNLRLLSANVFVPEDCLYLGERIITLASAVLGQKSGYPLLNSLNQYRGLIEADESVQ
ncbi:uncharacterized protein LOC105692205 [Athalia rosae]|uniref:uncharacterized protein LOC105692205 n=1 Tax=Athalia rosae TaxID=37344 RepID=UPI00062523A4|nr:uncharacterized protein LOC105692205 [Athalia rosae]